LKQPVRKSVNIQQVGSIVSLFLFGRKAQAKERIAKSQQIT
jgi:hypothetical protein